MAVRFSPDGFLDISTEASDLPSQTSGKDEVSGAMRRCTNLQLDKMGIAATRKGSSKVNAVAVAGSTASTLIMDQGEKRYLFANTTIYENEVSIKDGLAELPWSAIKYNPFNSTRQNIYAVNGSDRKRIESGVVYEWGRESPVDVPYVAKGTRTGLTGVYNVKYTYARKEGDAVVYESNPSDEAAASVTLANQSLWAKFEMTTDAQISAIRIYRTENSGIDYLHLMDVSVPTVNDYAYCYDWEKTYAYIAGVGFKITEAIPDTSSLDVTDCNALTDGDGAWTKVGTGWTVVITEASPGGSTAICLFTANGYDGSAVYTKTINSWDFSDFNTLHFRLYADADLTGVYLYFGETLHTEQIYGPFNLSMGWTTIDWDISLIAAASRNAVTKVAFRHDNHDGGGNYRWLYCDEIYLGEPGSSITGLLRMFSWEPVGLTDDPGGISIQYWEPIIIDDDTPDSSLGTPVDEDHDRPPNGTFVFGPSYTGMCFMTVDNNLYYCREKRPEYWPTDYYLEVGPKDFPLKAGTLHNGQIHVASAIQIWMIPGTSQETFGAPIDMKAITGTLSQRCFLSVSGFGIFHLGNDGLYLYSDSGDQNLTNERFRPIFDGETVGSIPGIDKTNISNSWIRTWRNKLYFGYPQLGSTYPDQMIVTDLKTGRAVHYDYGRTFTTLGIDNANDRLLAVDTVGFIWEIEDADATDDNGTAIKMM